MQVLRLPAIYGPGRNPFVNLRTGTARLIHKPGQVFSRVHVDDIVGAVLHSLALPPEARPDTLILADDCPCPSSEILGLAAHLLGCPLPDLERYEDIAASMSSHGPQLLERESASLQPAPARADSAIACATPPTGRALLSGRGELPRRSEESC